MAEIRKINPTLGMALRFIANASAWTGLVFVINNFLTHVAGLPPAGDIFSGALAAGSLTAGALFQFALYCAAIIITVLFMRRTGGFEGDSVLMDRMASRIIAGAFWAVFFIGIADAFMSFLRVEGLHTVLFGEEIGKGIALSAWRGVWVHIPLMVIAGFIGWRDRTVPVVWLILLVVLAELLIVIARFIFAYEQTFMGDLVRFWYAALFLFAAAFTLKEEGHVRVDVIFAGFTERTKAWLNATGTAFFGIPLCWVILWRGLSGKSSIINGPLLAFETTMSGFGMYVKYLMAGFLIVFAVSMLVQFTAYFLSALAVLNGDRAAMHDTPDAPEIEAEAR